MPYYAHVAGIKIIHLVKGSSICLKALGSIFSAFDHYKFKLLLMLLVMVLVILLLILVKNNEVHAENYSTHLQTILTEILVHSFGL